MGDPHELIKRAEKKLQGGGGFMALFSGPKFQDAQDLYVQAGNAFKLQKDFQAASEQFLQAAFCAQKQENTSEEATFYQNAGDCLKKINLSDAIVQYEKSVKIWSAAGRFNSSAKLLKTMAEERESEGVHDETARDQVIDLYMRAADLFEMEDFGKTMYSQCMFKVADHTAHKGDYQKSIEIFETEARKALSNNLLQYGAKEHFLKAGILTMCLGDSVTSKLALEKYGSADPRFDSSREGQLFAKLVEAVEDNDVEAFEQHLFEYDNISKLDSWKTTFLLKVKGTLTGSGVANIAGGNPGDVIEDGEIDLC